jgi:small ligand-binding sensory domain FIST
MKFQSLLSDDESSDQAVGDIIDSARAEGLGETDVAFVFMTADHREDADEIVEKLWLELDPQCIVGCLAEGVIGADREIEREPGIAVLVGTVPNVRLHPFHIAAEDWQELINDRDALSVRLGVGETTRAIIGFGDPWTTPLNQLTQALDQLCPHAPLIGGMASAARQQGENVLIRNDKTHS